MRVATELLKDFVSIFYPELCAACTESLNVGEKLICLECRYSLPRTNFHLEKDNSLEKVFWGRIPIQQAASFLIFRKSGKVQHLLHAIKYHGLKEAAELLGHWYGEELLRSTAFSETDFIIPVPLHPDKEKKRGFNQSEYFGKGLSSATGIPQETNNLIRTVASETQTKKTRYMRWENVAEIFSVLKPERLEGKTVLLIDDVVTTGATLEACARTLLDLNCSVKINVATLAFAT